MAYRSQLVIRTSEPHGAEVLERVKTLADAESKTISEKAIELLAMAMDGAIARTDQGDSEPVAPVEKVAVVEKVEKVEKVEERAESAVRRDPGPALASPSVKQKDPKVRPDEAPDQAALRCVVLFGDEGANAAAQALTQFFAVAEPVDGANIREELQERMTKTDYDALMEELKQTDEYREYRRRVVYASW